MTTDDVIQAYFEALKPTPKEVQRIIEPWPVVAKAGQAAQHPEQKGMKEDV